MDVLCALVQFRSIMHTVKCLTVFKFKCLGIVAQMTVRCQIKCKGVYSTQVSSDCEQIHSYISILCFVDNSFFFFNHIFVCWLLSYHRAGHILKYLPLTIILIWLVGLWLSGQIDEMSIYSLFHKCK